MRPRRNCKRLKAKAKQAEVFAPKPHPLGEVASGERQSDLSTEAPGCGESVTIAQKNIYITDRIDGSANEQL